MNVNFSDGITHKERIANLFSTNKALNEFTNVVNKEITDINATSSLELRIPYAQSRLLTKTSQLESTLNTIVTNITDTTNTQSGLDATQITTTMNSYAGAFYVGQLNSINAAKNTILASVDDEIAALTAAGTPPTLAKQDEMYRVALGYPDAADKATAEGLYMSDQLKSVLGFPNASTANAALVSYILLRKNIGLGFPYLVNLLGGHNLPRATAVLSGASVDSVDIEYGGIGYTYSPNVLFIGGGGTSARGTVNLAYRIVGVTITSPGDGYDSLRPVEIVGGGGSNANIRAELRNGKLYSLTIIQKGTGFTSVPTINIINGNNSFGNGATATVTLGEGYISGVDIDAGGTGYTSIPSVEFVDNSFEGSLLGTIDGTGKFTDIRIDNAGSYYSSAPIVVPHPNGTGSGAIATVTVKNGSLDTVTLVNGGTGYNTNEITLNNTEDLYDDYQLRVAFGNSSAVSSSVAIQEYRDEYLVAGYGIPGVTTVSEASTAYYNEQLEAQINDPSLIPFPKAVQDARYKTNFGFPTAPSVNAAIGLYRSQRMRSLVSGIDVTFPEYDPVKKAAMSVETTSVPRAKPKIEKKENQLNEITKRTTTTSIVASEGSRKERKKQFTKFNEIKDDVLGQVNKEVSNIYNYNSFYQRDEVVYPLYLIAIRDADINTIASRDIIINNQTPIYTAETDADYLTYNTEGTALATVAMYQNGNSIAVIQAEIAVINTRADNEVDSIVANRNVYQQQINGKLAIITDNADIIKDDVQKRIDAYGIYNPPSQATQDQMFKDGYGYPGAVSVNAARQSYIDNSLKVELGFPNAASASAAETNYIDLGVKTQLGFPDAVDIPTAAADAKAVRRIKYLGYPSEYLYYVNSLCKTIGYPKEVTNIKVTNEGSGYKSPPVVSFGDCGVGSVKPTAYSVINKFGKVKEIVVTYGGSNITGTPTVILSGGEGENATAVVSNNIPDNDVTAQAFYRDQYINNSFGYPNDGIDVSNTKQKYINAKLVEALGYGDPADLEEAKLRYYDRVYQTILRYPDSTRDKTRAYINKKESETTINGIPTDFLKRYSVARFPNITDNNAAELMWYYDNMYYYLTNPLPGKTLEFMNQLYKDGFGYPARATALVTISAIGIIDSVTVTNPNENSGYYENLPPSIYVNGVLKPSTITLSNGRITDINIVDSTVYTSIPTVNIVRPETEEPVFESVVYGGSGYFSPPTVNLLRGAGTGAIFSTTVENGELINVNVVEGGSYTELPEAEIVSAPEDTGKGAKLSIILNSQGKIETYIPVVEAQDGFTISKTSQLLVSKIDSSIKNTFVNQASRSTNIQVENITHEERVYGRKPLPTATSRSAMILKSGYTNNLSNKVENKSMGLSSFRKPSTRQNRLAQNNNYTTFYRNAEAYVKFKIIEGSNSVPPVTYSPAEKHQMFIEQLKLLKGNPKPKQTPAINSNIGESFSVIENTGKPRNFITHDERIEETRTLSSIQKQVNVLVSEIERENGGSVTINVGVNGNITSCNILDKGQNFKYAPRVRFISPTGIEASATSTLDSNNSLDSIVIISEGSGYLTINTTVKLLISPQELSEIEEKIELIVN